MDDKLISPAQLARLLGVPLPTVYAWRAKGAGPRGIRVGKHVRYRISEVEAWMAANTDRQEEAP